MFPRRQFKGASECDRAGVGTRAGLLQAGDRGAWEPDLDHLALAGPGERCSLDLYPSLAGGALRSGVIELGLCHVMGPRLIQWLSGVRTGSRHSEAGKGTTH